MKLKMYAIYDAVSGTFAQPHCAINDQTAARSCVDLLRRDENLKLHKEDYSLYRVGDYDDQTGRIENSDKPELIVKLATLEQVQ